MLTLCQEVCEQSFSDWTVRKEPLGFLLKWRSVFSRSGARDSAFLVGTQEVGMLPYVEYEGAKCIIAVNWHNAPMTSVLLFTILVFQRTLTPRDTELGHRAKQKKQDLKPCSPLP